MWKVIQSFRRDNVENVTKWHSTFKCWLGLLCWTICNSNFLLYVHTFMDYGVMGFSTIILIYIFYAIPLSYCELALGQFSKCSYINIWNLSPPFKGIGLTCLFALSTYSLHDNVMLAAYLNYLSGSFRSPVPWLQCSRNWDAKDYCYEYGENTTWRVKCIAKSNYSYCNSLKLEDSTTHYWTQVVAVDVPLFSTEKRSLEKMQQSLINAVIVFVILRRGIGSIEFFIPVLTILPHVLQCILFVVPLMLPGGDKVFTSTPNATNNYKSLTKIASGAIQTLKLGIGGRFMFGSEDGNFRAPVHVAVIIVYVICFIACVMFAYFCLSALYVFSYYAHIDADLIYGFKQGLLFTHLSRVFKQWPWAPQIWCSTYFFTLYMVAIRGKVFILYALLSGIFELFPNVKHYCDLVSFVVVTSDYLLSSPFYDKSSFDSHTLRLRIYNSMICCIIVLYEVFVLVFIYGARNLTNDIHFMLGFRPSAFWRACWHFLPPLSCLLFFFTIFQALEDWKKWMSREKKWIVGIVLGCWGLAIAITPIYMLFYFWRRWPVKWHKVFKPNSRWGPADMSLKRSREMFTEHSMTKEFLYRQQRFKSQYKTEET